MCLFTKQPATHKGRLSLSAPPTARGGPDSGALPPRMLDAKALIRPRMQDADLGEKVVSELRDPRPGGPIFLAAPFERTSPEIGDPETELVECPNVSRHRVISQEASGDLPQPLPLFGNGLMPLLSNLLLNFLELSPQTVASGLPFDQEATVA